ncbi:MAG: AGE family epimerase/isomerase, partial [Gammaproteobacteria bacterium]|nr:AGE family epimerase/isomerase [Gammaproteobacteria bacterium]
MSESFSDSLQTEFYQELLSIADWWIEHVIDFENDRFVGEVDDSNNINPVAHKSAVFSTRLLLFFSEVARMTGKSLYAEAADLVYRYLIKYFVDQECGGIYWEVNSEGVIVNPRKQVYAQAFYIYALCAYYRLTGKEESLQRAGQLHELLETFAHDDNKKGYIEALSCDWGLQDDLRLSEKEPNLPKTMNTHLHVLEAYTSLHAIKKNDKTRKSLRRILDYFLAYFINYDAGHLNLFFDADWNNQSPGYSYGHDIEASWLLWEAAEILGD